jgi:hypothetical protein
VFSQGNVRGWLVSLVLDPDGVSENVAVVWVPDKGLLDVEYSEMERANQTLASLEEFIPEESEAFRPRILRVHISKCNHLEKKALRLGSPFKL